jgi:hypothetical protein
VARALVAWKEKFQTKKRASFYAEKQALFVIPLGSLKIQ